MINTCHVGLSALLDRIYGCRQSVRSEDMHGVCVRVLQVGCRVWELYVMSELLDFSVRNSVNQWLRVSSPLSSTDLTNCTFAFATGKTGPDGSCTECDAGKYKTSSGSAACTDCSAGTYSGTTVASAC
jgi:hypothetical protein